MEATVASRKPAAASEGVCHAFGRARALVRGVSFKRCTRATPALFGNALTDGSLRVSDLLCMSNLSHASILKEHDNNDDFQGSSRRAA